MCGLHTHITWQIISSYEDGIVVVGVNNSSVNSVPRTPFNSRGGGREVGWERVGLVKA